MQRSVLIVDDHDGFRSRAARALEADGFQVVGQAADLASGLAESARLQPDVVLLDIHLPDGCGVESAPTFAQGAPGASVILISTYDAQDLGHVIGQPGIVGFLPKAELSGAALEALLEAGTARRA